MPPPVWPVFDSLLLIRGLSLSLVLVFAPRGFSPGTPVFFLSAKTNTSKFQFDLESVPH